MSEERGFPLIVQDLKKSFIVQPENLEVLGGISFTLKEKELIAIVGPSGCGKSTLLNIINGLLPYDGGKVALSGKVATVFQIPRLLPWKNALQNIIFGIECEGRKISQDDVFRAKKLVELVGLKDFEEYFPRKLSIGMQQRVNLARALAVNPKIILMDEPFAGLDAILRERMQDELIRIIQQISASIILVTHQVEEAAYLADRVLVFSSRPASVKEEFSINLANRQPEIRFSNEFLAYAESIKQALK